MSIFPDPGTPGADVVNGTLWRLEFADGNFCVARTAERLYLVLFTSTERAREFLESGSSPGPAPANAVLYSESGAQFERAARVAVEEGLSGAVIDPEPSGQVQMVVDFVLAPEQRN